MSTFILLSAMPGSGKSTWAKRYQRQNPNVEIVSSDEIRSELNGDAGDQSNPRLIWAEYLRRIKLHEKGEEVTVIGDSTNLTNYFRTYYAEEAAPHYDKKVCLQRNNARTERVVPPQAMEALRKEYEPLSEEAASLYDEIYVVDENGQAKRIK